MIDEANDPSQPEAVGTEPREDQPFDVAPANDPITGLPAGVIFGADKSVPGRAVVKKTSVQVMQWQSQYPPPAAVRAYEDVLPGSFNRILTLVEEGQKASISTATTVNKNIHSDARRGSWQGTMVTLVAMVFALICAYINQPVLGGVFLGVPVLSVARALIATSRGKSRDSTSTD